MTAKRKVDSLAASASAGAGETSAIASTSSSGSSKRRKVQGEGGQIKATPVTSKPDKTPEASKQRDGAASRKERPNMRKLAPPRPFPTVPKSVSATGPPSAHDVGKNLICVTRRSELGRYMRRCKDAVIKYGYKTLHLSAMGAAIPHLLQLSLAIPEILPFSPDEIHTEVTTGTVEVRDEILPDNDDEDVVYKMRGKSTLTIVIKIGDGVDEVSQKRKATAGKPGVQKGQVKGRDKNKGKGKTGVGEITFGSDVWEEPEQD